jgi:hypothetical protein
VNDPVCPHSGIDESTYLTTRFLSQLSEKTGIPKTGVVGHSIAADGGQDTTTGGTLSETFTVSENFSSDWQPESQYIVSVSVNEVLQSLPAITVTVSPVVLWILALPVTDQLWLALWQVPRIAAE